MITYKDLQEDGELLGRGRYREVYRYRSSVYKAIMPEMMPCDCNEVELSIYSKIDSYYKPYCASAIYYNEDNSIIQTDYVEPLEHWVVENDIVSLGVFLNYCSECEEPSILDFIARYDINLYCDTSFIEYMRDTFGICDSELLYPCNWGVKGNELILVDYGTIQESTMDSMDVFQQLGGYLV